MTTRLWSQSVEWLMNIFRDDDARPAIPGRWMNHLRNEQTLNWLLELLMIFLYIDWPIINLHMYKTITGEIIQMIKISLCSLVYLKKWRSRKGKKTYCKWRKEESKNVKKVKKDGLYSCVSFGTCEVHSDTWFLNVEPPPDAANRFIYCSNIYVINPLVVCLWRLPQDILMVAKDSNCLSCTLVCNEHCSPNGGALWCPALVCLIRVLTDFQLKSSER